MKRELINTGFFDVDYKTKKRAYNRFLPISEEMVAKILAGSLNFHEDVYLLAEAKMEKELGRKLAFGEMMKLHFELRFNGDVN